MLSALELYGHSASETALANSPPCTIQLHAARHSLNTAYKKTESFCVAGTRQLETVETLKPNNRTVDQHLPAASCHSCQLHPRTRCQSNGCQGTRQLPSLRLPSHHYQISSKVNSKITSYIRFPFATENTCVSRLHHRLHGQLFTAHHLFAHSSRVNFCFLDLPVSLISLTCPAIHFSSQPVLMPPPSTGRMLG
jgi:hypothetical protein